MEAQDLFDLMVHMGVKPDVCTYNTLIGGYLFVGKMDEVRKLLDNMCSIGLKQDDFTYSILIDGYSKNGRIDDALVVIREMDGVKPSIITFNIMIGVLLKGSRMEEAKDLFDGIWAKGLVPDVVTYSLMIQKLIEEGSLQESDDLFLSMEKNGCAADSRMLNAIVRSLLQKGDVPRAGTYLSKIDERSFTLEASTASLLTALASGRKGQEYKGLLPEKYHSFLEQGTLNF